MALPKFLSSGITNGHDLHIKDESLSCERMIRIDINGVSIHLGNPYVKFLARTEKTDPSSISMESGKSERSTG